MSGQRLVDALAELGLFQRPVFDVEQIGLANRLEPAYRLGIGDCLDIGFGDVGGDPRIPGAASEPEQPETRHEDHPRHRVELAFWRVMARVVTGEISMVLGNKASDSLVHRLLERVEPTRLRGRHDQRVILGADRVIRGCHAGAAVAPELGPVNVVEHRSARTKIEDEPLIGPRACRIGDCAGAAQDRRDLGWPGERYRHPRRGKHGLAATREPPFGNGDRRDHALISLLRRIAEGKDPMFQQHEPFDGGI